MEPTTGEAFWGELPRLAADGFGRCLEKVRQHYAESLNMILLAQAPAHTAQRGQVPDHIGLVWLPAYSPELTPGERLWEDLTPRLDGLPPQVRSKLGALQEQVAELLQRSTAEMLASLTG